MRGGEHLDRRALCVWLEPIQFVLDAELGGHTAHQRVRRLANDHLEVTITVVAARAAAHQITVVFRPVVPVVPKAWVQTDQALAARDVAHDRFLRGGVGERFVVADDQHIHAGDHVREAAGGFGVVRSDATSVVERLDIGLVEPLLEIVA